MNKKIFIKNTLILTSTTLLINLLAMGFRVFLSQKITAEGIGLFSLVVTVYIFSATFATSGITLSVTRLVTDYLARGKGGAVKYLIKRSIVFSICLSSFVGALLYFFAKPIGVYYLCDQRSVLPLKILAVSLPFMAVSACLRGYFYARRTGFSTASEQLIEQIIEMGVFMISVFWVDTKNIEIGCSAVVMGTTIGEVVTSIYSYLLYRLDMRKISGRAEKETSITKKMLSIGIPVTLSSCLRSGLSMIENILIPDGLKKYGENSKTALGKYGEITGMALPILLFPNVLLVCFSMLLIPEMSEAKITNRKREIEYMAERILRFSLLFALPVSGIFLFFGQELGMLFYNNREVGIYISILAPVVPLLYLDKVVDGMLKGLNEQLHYLMYNIIDSVLRVMLTFILVPKIGMKGVIIVLFLSAIVNSGLSIARLIKVANVKVFWLNWIIKPVIAAILSGFIVTDFIKTNLILEMLSYIIIFVLINIILKTIKKEEIIWINKLFLKRI